jgi:hypothetical protein
MNWLSFIILPAVCLPFFILFHYIFPKFLLLIRLSIAKNNVHIVNKKSTLGLFNGFWTILFYSLFFSIGFYYFIFIINITLGFISLAYLPIILLLVCFIQLKNIKKVELSRLALAWPIFEIESKKVAYNILFVTNKVVLISIAIEALAIFASLFLQFI